MINKRVKKAWCAMLFIGLIAAMTFVFMLLWNLLVPVIFNGIVITFWQALGLLVMAKLLFGGFGFWKAGLFAHHHHHHHQRQHQKEMQKLHEMSKEERKEYIRRHFKEGHNFWCGNEPSVSDDENEK